MVFVPRKIVDVRVKFVLTTNDARKREIGLALLATLCPDHPTWSRPAPNVLRPAACTRITVARPPVRPPAWAVHLECVTFVLRRSCQPTLRHAASMAGRRVRRRTVNGRPSSADRVTWSPLRRPPQVTRDRRRVKSRQVASAVGRRPPSVAVMEGASRTPLAGGHCREDTLPPYAPTGAM